MGYHSHTNQYLPFNPVYFDRQSSIVCPCYNLLKFNPIIEKCDFKQESEHCTENVQVNSINNNRVFDNAQQSTWDYNAQQQQYITEQSKTHLENEIINNCAFTNLDYKVEILDEKIRKNLIKKEYLDKQKDLEKGTYEIFKKFQSNNFNKKKCFCFRF